jgi:hypothetical protein
MGRTFQLFFVHLLAIASAAKVHTTASQLACSALSAGSLKSLVATSGSKFEAGATHAWNLLNSQLVPACVVLPQTTAQVAAAMAVIYKTGAQYAVQSAGGHSAMEGWNKYVVHMQWS